MRPNRAELAVLRGKRDPQALSLWAKIFGGGNEKRASRFGLAVATFLGQPPTDPGSTAPWTDYLGQYSPNTRKAYAFALTEFFEWVAAHHGRVVSPEKVTRLDAEQYVAWLANRPFSLAEEKLKDGDQQELLELFEIVKQSGSANLNAVVSKLSSEQKQRYFGANSTDHPWNRKKLSQQLRKMVTMDVLEAIPTLSALRAQYPQAGLTVWELPLGKDGSDVKLEDVFTYSVKEYKAASRTTISQRVSALSSFWKVMMTGENTEGGEALLQYNIWDTVKERVSRGLNNQKKEASRLQKMPSDKVIQMLRDAPARTLVNLRNKALLYLMVFAGVRTTEILMLRRGKPDKGTWKAWFDGNEPPSLQLLRKGNKWQRLPYPPAALKTLIEFQHELEKHSAPTYAQHTDPGGEHYIARDSSAWYYRDLQLPDAPLFPPLSIWGNNKRVDYRKPLSRIQCFRILRTIARDVRMTPEEIAKVHPHAIRHFSANAMVAGGKDLREVQAILGHSSVTTTESYLEDVDDQVKLSGQDAILTFLDARGVEVQPMHVPESGAHSSAKPKTSIDTTAYEISDAAPEVSLEELQVLQQLSEPLPTHELPEAPPEYSPEVVAMAMPGDKPPLLDTEGGLVGLDGKTPSEEALEGLAASVIDGKSPGSPAWVYETMANPRSTHETVVFNRGGERDIAWLREHYATLPTNFGVGHESYLPWYVKARGNISRGGFFKGLPPFPVFSPEQCNPETKTGEGFLSRLEATYSVFVHGDPEKGLAPSPLRSVGIVRWYSFFVYHGTKMADQAWEPWNAVVDLGRVRMHDDAWLVQWMADNAHTYRASIDAMKRGVSRTEEDITSSFLKSSFEGVELITEVPEWMIFDDPVQQLHESDPGQWKEMISWLKNVTGQQLDAPRKKDRAKQEKLEEDEQKVRAKNVRDVLTAVIKLIDQLEHAKHHARQQVKDLRGQLRTQLYWYATAASGATRLRVSLDMLKDMSTKEFNEAMAKEYERLGVPNPNAEPYRSLKGRKKVSAIVVALFPNLPELNDGNVFADSKLFNPRWFRIDEDKHTVFIETSERAELEQQFGQDPELLVRRAVRAMWEARDKGYDALWGIMMSYFSWIVPSGREMESQVRGIPVAELGSKEQNAQARKNWLHAWTKQMKRLAMGQDVEPLGEDVEEKEPELEPWQKFLAEEDRKKGQDALDYLAGDGVDFAMSTAVSGGYFDSPEDLLMQMEEEGDEYTRNQRLVPNGSGTGSLVYLKGERPKQWYKVDLFGRRQGFLRPNAPPTLVSPGVLYRAQKKVFPARQLLPSPFRMIAAIDLSEPPH